MPKSTRIPWLALLLLAACGPDSPAASVGESFLRSQIDEGKNSTATLVWFHKTDGQTQEIMGVRAYLMDFEARLEFLAEGLYEPVRSISRQTTGINLLPKPTSQGFWDEYWMGMRGQMPFCKGDQLLLTGQILFESKESGWNASGVGMNLVRDSTGRATGCGQLAQGVSPISESSGPTDLDEERTGPGLALGRSVSASLDTEEQKASYGLGLQMGEQLFAARNHVDYEAFMAGFLDALNEREPSVSSDAIQRALTAFSAAIQEDESGRKATAASENASEGIAFLALNAEKDGVVVTASGLQYEVIKAGDGPTPGATDRVQVHYRGTLIDGTQFDSSYDRGQPNTFSLSAIIAGLSEGIQLMTVGSHFRFFIPPEIGYGPNGSGRVIGPNATLILEVELLEVEH